jgi:serine/threonine-protein kinase
MQSMKRCPSCGAEFAVKDEGAARPVNCPFCGTVVPVPKEKAGEPDLVAIRRQLVESELIGVETLDQQIEQWRQRGPVSDAKAGADLLRWLADGQFLNRFQADALRAGQCESMMFGPYRVYDRVAFGRLGAIYRAVHEEFQQPVCLKILPASLQDRPEDLVRMQREIRIAAMLEHPNVVRVYQIGRVGDTCYLAFEDLQGETLQERLQRDGALECGTACGFMRDAAQGLGHFHDKFIVHRDVQPRNLWITAGGTLKVMEWGAVRQTFRGVAVSTESTVTSYGQLLNAFSYTAPEQIRDAHAADHRSDIYSLGRVFYHCLTGQLPTASEWTREDLAALICKSSEEIPEAVVETLEAMLAPAPDERLQSMTDVAQALEPFAALVQDEAAQRAVPTEFLIWMCDMKSSVTRDATPFVAWLAKDAGANKA